MIADNGSSKEKAVVQTSVYEEVNDKWKQEAA